MYEFEIGGMKFSLRPNDIMGYDILFWHEQFGAWHVSGITAGSPEHAVQVMRNFARDRRYPFN